MILLILTQLVGFVNNSNEPLVEEEIVVVSTSQDIDDYVNGNTLDIELLSVAL